MIVRRADLDTRVPSLHITLVKRSVMLLLAVAVVHAQAAGALSREQRLARYIAGCEIVADAAAVTPATRAAAMRSLTRLTGITPDRAVREIESYRNRPEAWERVLEQVRQALLEQDTVSQTKQQDKP